MADKIQVKAGTASEWTSVDPVLAEGEFGLETDTRRGKYGDGVSKWSELPYWVSTSYGPTSDRPSNVMVGYPYYDTDLLMPIWWSGSEWRDANKNII